MSKDLTNKTAVLYARTSTHTQSTKIQLQQLEKFCKDNKITIIDKFDENVSGAAEHREKLEYLLNSEPLAELLIIREVSRLSREEDYNEAYNKLQRLLKKYSIYIYLDEIYLERGKSDLAQDITMMVKLFGAADERKKIRDRTSTAISKYKENSVINVYCGKKGFGLMKADNPNYIKGTNTKQIWVKNPEEWDIVLRVFQLRADGYSILKITQITHLNDTIIRQIFRSKIIRYYMELEHAELLGNSEIQREKMKTVKAPSKHPNKYKGIIFYEDTKMPLVHHSSTARGSVYKLRNGVISLNEPLIDDVVERTIRCMLVFFDLKKKELSKDNEERLEILQSMKEGYTNTNINLNNQIAQYRKKFLKAPDEETMKMITDEMNRLKEQTENNNKQLVLLEAEEKRIKSIDYNKIGLDINQNNLKDYINKYIRRVELWRKDKLNVIVKVYVKEGFIGSNWYDYKQYQVYNKRGHKITPLHIDGEGGSVTVDETQTAEDRINMIGAGGFWSLKVYQLPYYPDAIVVLD